MKEGDCRAVCRTVNPARPLRRTGACFTDPGQEDVSIGVPMGKIFALAKEYIETPPVEIEKLLESPIHEVRVGAVSIMDWQARSKKPILWA